MRALLISNPNSTSSGGSAARHVIPALQSVPGMQLRAKFTAYPGHATQLCRGLTREDVDAVIVLGGDGTVNEVVNGLLGPPDEDGGPRVDPASLPVVGVVPTGSANVFARALGFPNAPGPAARELAKVIAAGLTRRIGLGTWGKTWFCVNAGFGVDAEVIAKVEQVRSQGFAATPLRYLAVAAQVWARAQMRPPQIAIRATTSAGERVELDNIPLFFASNTNPWTFLGPLPVVTNPRNSFDRGLGLFALTSLTGWAGVANMAHLVGVAHLPVLGRYLAQKVVIVDDAAEVVMRCEAPLRFQIDGELEGEFSEVRLRSHRDALEVFAPQNPIKPGSRPLWQVLRDFIRVR